MRGIATTFWLTAALFLSVMALFGGTHRAKAEVLTGYDELKPVYLFDLRESTPEDGRYTGFDTYMECTEAEITIKQGDPSVADEDVFCVDIANSLDAMKHQEPQPVEPQNDDDGSLVPLWDNQL